MLFKKELWDRLADGTVALAFRRWKRPTVTTGGTLKTPAGVLAIDEVAEVTEASITADDAAQAGYGSLDELRRDLRFGADRRTFRIAFHHAGPDPRDRLRQNPVDDTYFAEVVKQLDRFDMASRDGAWTRRLLAAIEASPAVPSRDLAERLDEEQARLKRRVRCLKDLGLTDSLGTGYQLSPRGHSVAELLTAQDQHGRSHPKPRSK